MPFTVSVNVVMWVAEAPVPMMVIENVPLGVLDDVLIVSVEEPPEVTGLAENVAVAPEGSPDADSVTLCALPEVVAVETVETVEVAEAPAFTVAKLVRDGAGDGVTVCAAESPAW